MTLVAPIVAAPVGERRWQRHLAVLAVVAVALLALFARDAARTVATWWTSSTFGHCLLVPPIIAWLVWQRRALLARLRPVAWVPGLAIVGVGAAMWLVGEAGAVTVLREFGLLAMMQGAVVTLLGPVVARGLAFPLGYAFFLVPFGEFLEPPLQAVTVRLAMPLLALARIPASSNGVIIHAGAYWFEVAEACSGAKFVIAMLAVGALVANLCFERWRRRIAFLAACVVVPVLANGVRAAMTMVLADRIGIAAASGFDHIVYGWLWFGVVIAGMLAAGWRWFDRAADAPAFDPARLDRPTTATMPLIAAAALTLSIAAAAALWGAAASARTSPLPDRLELPQLPGWQRAPLSTRAPWRPYHPGADRDLIGRYVDAAGDRVDVAVALYEGQRENKSLAAYGTGAIGEGPWRRVADMAPIAGASAMRIVAPGGVERIVTTRYIVAGTATRREAVVKLATLRAHLLGGSQVAVAVHLSAEVVPDHDARTAIARLAAALPPMPVIEAR